MSKKSFVKGAAILGIAGLLCKVIGAVFRIPLAGILGTNGMAYYQIAYPIYSALLVISSAGLPSAVSKLVSERVAVGDYRNAHYTFQVAFRVLALIGVSTGAIMLAGSRLFAMLQGIPDAFLSIVAISPSLFFVSVLSAYRGYFQGLQMMTPTAVSQVIEQVGKLVAGITLSRLFMVQGPLMGAVGALLGVTISELVALIYMLVLYNRRKGEIKHLIRTSPRVNRFEPKQSVRRKILTIAIPITIGASIMPLVQLIDNAMVVNILKGIGYSQLMAENKFALLTGYVAPIINMPAILSTALQMSLVPAISSAVASHKKSEARQTATIGMKLAVLIGMPCAVGLFIMGGPTLALLYRALLENFNDIATAASIMSVMSIALLFLTMIQTCTGIIQGVGHPSIPVRNLAIGAVVKVIISFILLRRPEINVLGAPIGTVACYAVAATLNIVYIVRHMQVRLRIMDFIVRPALATAGMGLCAYGCYMLLIGHVSNLIATALSILLAVLVYAVLVLVLKALRPEDAKLLPGGSRLDYMMRRIGIWR